MATTTASSRARSGIHSSIPPRSIRCWNATAAIRHHTRTVSNYSEVPAPYPPSLWQSGGLQLAAQNLAGGGFGDGRDEIHAADGLVVGELAVGEDHQLFIAKARALAQRHERARNLASALVGPADHRRLANGRLLQQHGL